MNSHLLPYPYNQTTSRHVPGLKALARFLYDTYIKLFPPLIPPPPAVAPIRVVCESDTHNAVVDVPAGDLLIHAGDLTKQGTLEELQSQLRGLSSLPHKWKVVIAGNHDCLLDASFIDRSRTRVSGNKALLASELTQNGLVYLENDSAVLNFDNGRVLKVYGSPNTPEYGNWAFQYPAIRDFWTGKIPDDANIVVTQSPPALHRDAGKGGDGYLLRELKRCKPSLVVCGHAHDGYGQEVLLHDGVQSALDDILLGADGLFGMARMLVWMPLAALRHLLGRYPKSTRLVNAALAPGAKKRDQKSPIVLDL